jgi:tetratricopeptide (TPR) repeat protein
MMGRIILIISFLAFIALSCTKMAVPGSGQGIKRQESDARYDYYYVEGLRNKLTGSPADAMAMFEECIKIDPSRDGAYYQIAQIAYAVGDMNNAVRYGRKALDLSNNIWHHMLIGNAYYKKGNIDSAIVVLEKARTEFPEEEELLFTLGNLYFESGRFLGSIQVFEYFDRKYGVGGSSAIPLIRSLLSLKRFEEAEVRLKLLIELYPDEQSFLGMLAEMYRDSGQLEKAAGVYEQLFSSEPDDIRTLVSLVDFFRRDGNYTDIFGMLNAVAIKDAIPEEEKVNFFAAQLDDKEIIENYVREYEMALLILEAAHKESPLVKLLRPELYQLTNRKKEAAELLENYLLRWGDSYYAWEKLLLLYTEAQEYEKLYSSSTGAVRRFNTAILPRLLNALASVEIGFYDEALAQLQRVKRLNDDNKDLALQILSIEADALYRKGETDSAFARFDEALTVAPDDLVILNNYAYFLAEKDIRLRDARRMIERVMEIDTTNNTFNDTYAWVLFKQKKYRKAGIVMRNIVESEDNQNAEYFEHYGYILKALKRCEEAIISWKRALIMDSSREYLNTEIEKCLERRK